MIAVHISALVMPSRQCFCSRWAGRRSVSREMALLSSFFHSLISFCSDSDGGSCSPLSFLRTASCGQGSSPVRYCKEQPYRYCCLNAYLLYGLIIGMRVGSIFIF